VTVNGVRFGLAVCEDIWQPGGSVAAYASAGVDLLLCLNASPFEQGKDTIRHSVVQRRATEIGTPIAYVNNGQGVFINARYSSTTTHHQNIARCALGI
jgi:NAD+ synthase (glutamine-hydrolysing)